MRLAQLISETSDHYAYVHLGDDRMFSDDGTSRVVEFGKLVRSVEEIQRMTKSDRRKRWYRLALQSLELARSFADEKDRANWCAAVQESARYFQNALRNEPHRVDFVVSPEREVHKNDNIVG